MPRLLRGASVLLSSPTASGKTEAVFAPLYQRHVSFQRGGASVVYVAPTKALVNDMQSRLSEYFASSAPGLVQRYTGDHHEFTDPAGRFAVLCTPEALDSLQLVHPESLFQVRAVICDELHLLHGAARGQQLRSVIARIRQGSIPPADRRDCFQIVGMTATVQDQEAVARLWLGDQAEVVQVGAVRPIEMTLLRALPDEIAELVANRLRCGEHQKVLAFANSRNGAHKLAAGIHSYLGADGWPVYMHVGILSRGEREHIEYAMKNERRGICVATSTLEVGIDIGDVDLVVLCEPPRTVSSFLQRLGRGNRRSDRCIVWAISDCEEDRDLYQALLNCAQNGILDDVNEYHRFSVDFQQIIAAAWISVRNHSPLTRENYLERTGFSVDPATLEDMLSAGILRDIRGALVPSDEWMDKGEKREIHSVIAGAIGVPVFDIHSGDVIGFADEKTRDGVIYTGVRTRRVAVTDSSGVYVETLQAGQRSHLARLPSARGSHRGLSRQLTWSRAELSGCNPRIWIRDGSILWTWGGEDYNLLLAEIIKHAGWGSNPQHSAESISGLLTQAAFSPQDVREYAVRLLNVRGISAATARKFREASAFFENLSPVLQNREAALSVPREGFLRWLTSCEGIRAERRETI
jgi:ATP-dependent helicase Lhr and Lhr-like helicase